MKWSESFLVLLVQLTLWWWVKFLYCDCSERRWLFFYDVRFIYLHTYFKPPPHFHNPKQRSYTYGYKIAGYCDGRGHVRLADLEFSLLLNTNAWPENLSVR